LEIQNLKFRRSKNQNSEGQNLKIQKVKIQCSKSQISNSEFRRSKIKIQKVKISKFRGSKFNVQNLKKSQISILRWHHSHPHQRLWAWMCTILKVRSVEKSADVSGELSFWKLIYYREGSDYADRALFILRLSKGWLWKWKNNPLSPMDKVRVMYEAQLTTYNILQ
jgi:hypothetical protein